MKEGFALLWPPWDHRGGIFCRAACPGSSPTEIFPGFVQTLCYNNRKKQ